MFVCIVSVAFDSGVVTNVNINVMFTATVFIFYTGLSYTKCIRCYCDFCVTVLRCDFFNIQQQKNKVIVIKRGLML